jgi:hypothetical protein
MKNIFDKNRNSEIEDFKKHISDINGQNLYIEVFGLLMSGFLCFIIDLTDIIEILTNFFIFISNIFNNIINVLIINFYDIINNSFIKMNTFEQ